MAELRQRYRCPAGLSDHSGKIYAGLAAAALGAEMIEVHVTLSRECFGPDVPASLTTGELAQLAEGVDFIGRSLRSPVDKTKMASELSGLKSIFGKSVVAARDLPAGWELSESDLALKKPGTGLAPARLPGLLRRRLARPVAANTLLSEEDIEQPTSS